MPRRNVMASALVVGLLFGCAPTQEQAGQDRVGVQFTGTLDGSRVSGSDGNPVVVIGDCDPNDGADADVCLVTNTIDGTQIAMVIENPDLLVEGESVEVAGHDCAARECDDVTSHLVVDIRVDGVTRRADDGEVRVVQNDRRISLEFRFSFLGASNLTGKLNVRAISTPTP